MSVDPAYPNHWREAPYFDWIMRTAAARSVVVSVGSQVFTVRPEPHDRPTAGKEKTTDVHPHRKPARPSYFPAQNWIELTGLRKTARSDGFGLTLVATIDSFL